MLKVAGSIVALALVAARPVLAADPVAPRSGFYVGGHAGYGFGTATATLGDPAGLSSSGGANQYGTLFGGVQAGYEHYFPSRLMLGFETDLAFANYMDLNQVLSARATAAGSANEQLEMLGTLRGRVGYAMAGWTPFLTGGLAWASTRYTRIEAATGNEDTTPNRYRLGYALGGGVDFALDRRWSARTEYLYTNLGLTGLAFPSSARLDTQYDLHRFRVGLNYKFGEGDDDKKDERSDTGPGSWEVRGQSTFIFQGYPRMRGAYDGQNSLPAGGQSRETWTTGAFLGVRLWEGAELYYNPELLQGFGLANTTGAGGYTNGEAQKSNFPFPRYNTSRLYLRQEIGLGGETEKVEGEYGQLSGTKDVSRLTFQIGKFAVHDLFDGNTYAEDPRLDFLNWSIWAAGAFDYPADRVGLTYGATAELNRKSWAGRIGYFLVGNQPNANVFDLALFSRGGYVGELEMRFTPYNRPGAARFGTFLTSTFAGSYNDAVVLAAAAGGTANDTIAQTRQGRSKYGFYINLEQELSDDVGAFARFSTNDGRSEISAFTDIDTSLSGGLSIKGASWGRPDDTIGVAGVLNMLTSDHRNFLAAGGLGVLVGDGQLNNYAPEMIFETYYALRPLKGLTLTADYQLVANPAYNADRGPVHVFSGRMGLRF